MHHILFLPKKKAVVEIPLPLRLLLDGLVAMLKAAMRARTTRGSKNRTEAINEGRCNGIDWSMEVKGNKVDERRRVSGNESQTQIMTYIREVGDSRYPPDPDLLFLRTSNRSILILYLPHPCGDQVLVSRTVRIVVSSFNLTSPIITPVQRAMVISHQSFAAAAAWKCSLLLARCISWNSMAMNEAFA